MNIRASLTLSLACACASLPASGNDESGQAIAHLAVDFCGRVVGETSLKAREIAASLPELEMKAAEIAGQDWTSKIPPMLRIPADAPFHRVNFRDDGVDPFSFAALTTDLKTCVVVIHGDHPVVAALRDRVERANAGWEPIDSPPPLDAGWQRYGGAAPIVTMVLVQSGDTGVITVETETDKLPTLAEFDQFADSFVPHCASLALGRESFDAAKFGPMFSVVDLKGDKGETFFESRSDLASARIAVIPENGRHTCLIVLADRGLRFDPYVNAIRTAFRLAPGAIETGTDPKMLEITDVKSKHSATLRSARQKSDLLILIKGAQ